MATIHDLIRNMPKKRYVLTLANVSPWAAPLHFKEGFWVFDPDHLGTTLHKTFKDAQKGRAIDGQLISWILEATGRLEVNFLRAYTGEMRPPAKLGEGLRKAHPGGWSDVSGRTNNGYRIIWDKARGGKETARFDS